MTTKVFQFCINGLEREITLQVLNGGILTSKYCPKELLTCGISYIKPVNGEDEGDFVSDCQRQIIAMDMTKEAVSCLDKHIAGLMAVVMDHLSRCGRIIFGDLLIYMDCFSLLLEADGYDETKIGAMYPRILRTIIDLYPDKVFNTVDLSPFKGSLFDYILDKVLSNKGNDYTRKS